MESCRFESFDGKASLGSTSLLTGPEPSAIPLEQVRILNSDRSFSVHFCDHLRSLLEA
jgi:hypothetical protein